MEFGPHVSGIIGDAEQTGIMPCLGCHPARMCSMQLYTVLLASARPVPTPGSPPMAQWLTVVMVQGGGA